uniref:MULE transposase domain-containing protein n=1 Tax=Lactuca sativa TaxID=4236 RepID=A0A9R1V4B3_LACSA|nr:hypothetical protein LSAT_V11C600332550 [Lactuca sativa]
MYMTNKFKMPIAPFTGMNHHGHFILFGVELLENKKEEPFEWLFTHSSNVYLHENKHLQSDTSEELEAKWKVMHSKYKPEIICLISDMYNQCIRWAKPFLNDIFFVGMTTTG